MAGSYNKVLLMGNLTRDVEMRALPSGTNVAGFAIAVNERFKDRDGNWQERVNFIDCEFFGNRGEAFARYHSKGSAAFVEGKLRLDQWQDKEGNKRSKLKVVVDNFEFVGGRNESGGGGGGGGGRQPVAQGSQQDSYDPPTDDDIPF